MRRLLNSLSVLLMIFIYQFTAQGQTINGSISGTVIDTQDAVVSGATVTATNNQTGSTRTVETNDSGSFRFSGLPVGVYTVKVEKSGFDSLINNNVQVSVASDANLQLKLETGSVGATVDVSTTVGEVLDTTQSQVSKTVNEKQILELPGRNTLNGLALLNPGVLPNQNGRPGSGFAVNGNRTRSNNFTIDGANNNDQSLSIPRQNLPPEAVQQFQIITNTFAAEFGRNAGSYVNQITRSGTNEFHGTGFWTWQGNGLDALTTNQQRSFNTNVQALGPKRALRNTRNVTVDNIYGGTLGGPIFKNHTFFFTSIDSQDFRSTLGAVARTAFSSTARARLQLPGRGFDPGALNFLLSYPVANDPTPSGSITLAGTAAIACPASDPNCNVIPIEIYNRTQGTGVPYATQFDRGLFKINTKINDNDNLSFRYLVDKSYDPGQTASLPGQEAGQVLRNDSFTINDVYVITPSWLNEARFTYSRRALYNVENQGPQFTVTGAGALTRGNANNPQYRTDNVYEITDNISFTPSNHAFKFGYNLLIYKLASFFAPNSRGTISYAGLADFLQDRNAQYQRYAGDGLTDATTYENSWFAQDDWRVNQDLTLNLGVRYEYVTAPYGFFSEAKPDVNNIAPRVGFAWNPKNWADGKFVFRGGFALAYDQIFQNVLLNNSRNYPRGVNIAVTNVSGQRLYDLNNLPPAPSPSAYTGDPNLLDVRLFSPNQRIKQPMSRQITLSLQYQLYKDYVFKAEYITTNGSNLVREYETNYGFCSTALVSTGSASAIRNPLDSRGVLCSANPATLATARPITTRASIVHGQGIANSSYHAGQFTLEKRVSRANLANVDLGDITFNANYTYSAFISEADDILGGQANRTVTSDPRDPAIDKARSGFDQPHRFVINFLWGTPKIPEIYGSFLGRILNDWQLSAVGTYASGTPFSILNGNNALGITPSALLSTVQLSQRVSVNPSGTYGTVSVPCTVGSAGCTTVAPGIGQSNPSAYFIVNAASSGILGTLGANTERTGGTQNWNSALVKNIRTFSENQRLQLRMEVFNVFNHRNFTVNPANSLGNSPDLVTFLNLGRTNVGGRGFTFGARYFF